MGSILSSVLAQDTAVKTLRRALSIGRVHHAYLFDGPDGVGKELAAFGLAQALVCERRGPLGDDACGECSSCTRAKPRKETTRPVHPDIAILERGLYEPAQIGRRTAETQDISIDQVRTLVLARASFPPHEGRAKVFIVRRVDELSVAAANALLKTLEEPGKNTHFVLLTSQPDSLLSTIRSRTQRVRFAPLPDRIVADLLVLQGVETEAAREIAALSGGSAAEGTHLADPDESEKRESFVSRALAALSSPDLGKGLDLAEDAKKEKSGLDLRILALATRLAEQARELAGAGDARADAAVARYRLALVAARQLDGNASAQLVVESMIIRMRGA
ncbi:MAG: DNA polymerase III subunit delta' [Polyangiaceae bacterium]